MRFRAVYNGGMRSDLVTVLMGIIFILATQNLVLWQKYVLPSERAPVVTVTPSASEPSSPQSTSGITVSEVAKHSTSASCWSTINGNVYDLTSWIPEHPGGPEAIMKLCGADGSKKFNDKHGGQARQAAVLTGFKIGVAAP